MCGRSQFRKVPEIIEEFGPARVGDIGPGGRGVSPRSRRREPLGNAAIAEEAFPKSVVPGLVLHKGERVVSSFSWAFFDDGTGHNARLETAADRPAWREAYASARVILPLARFVEGRAWFSEADGATLAVAGLYRLGPRRATMLTRPADDVVAPFHERMPVILPADLIGPWLGGDPVSVARLIDESPALVPEPLSRPGPEQPTLL
jgi:hypothetical protein